MKTYERTQSLRGYLTTLKKGEAVRISGFTYGTIRVIVSNINNEHGRNLRVMPPKDSQNSIIYSHNKTC